jgi:uncharacterized protein (TIGR02117 family)
VIRRLARRLLLGFGVAVLVLCLVTVLTASHGDRSLYPATAEAGIEVFIVNHGYHAGIVLPRLAMAEIAARDGLAALRAVAARFSAFAALEIGWGDEGFYRHAPTLGTVTIPLALRALLRPGNASVLHVVGLNGAPADAFADSELVALRLSSGGFSRLLRKLDASFARNERDEILPDLGAGLYGASLFYRAVGSFHVFNVCNHWLARLLDAAGLPTSPVLATMPAGLLFDLRWRAGLRPSHVERRAR